MRDFPHFKPGVSGNPRGRPIGSGSRARNIENAKLAAIEGLIDRALSGDSSALAVLLAQKPAPVPHTTPSAPEAASTGTGDSAMTHDSALDGPDADVPASFTVSTRGLPPCRAALARYMAYRASIAADIDRLEAARDRLQVELARADAAKVEAETAFEQQASTLADSLKAGVDLIFSHVLPLKVFSKANPIPDARLARAALAKLEAELQAKQALADRLADRYSEFISNALREHGASLGQEYLALIDQLRNTIGRLHALNVACGGPPKRDVRAMLPGFSIAGQVSRPLQIGPSDHALGVAIASWRALGKAWATDAKAAPGRHLKFVQRDRQATEFLTP